MSYLFCNECGQSYQIKPGEDITDYDLCKCGGELSYFESLNDYYSSRGKSNNTLSNMKEEVLVQKALDSGVIRELEGGFNEMKDHYVYLTKEGLVVGESRLIGNKLDYKFITYSDIANIDFKEKMGKHGDIIIKTKSKDVIKGKGVRSDQAEGFVSIVGKILAGNNEILNNYSLSDIQTDEIPIYPNAPNDSFVEYGKIAVRADSSLFSKTATMNDANARLREEAVKLGANAIISVKYNRSSLTSWRGMKATGTAVFIESSEKLCPFCAEKIKKESTVCKHCGKELKYKTSENGGMVDKKGSVLDEIKKAQELLDLGAITQEEFDEIKRKCIDKI